MDESHDNGMTEPCGEVTHFYAKPMVAVVRLTAKLANGDKVKIMGATSDFEMTVKGIRNEDEQEVDSAESGEMIAFKTPEIARPGDKVLPVADD